MQKVTSSLKTGTSTHTEGILAHGTPHWDSVRLQSGGVAVISVSPFVCAHGETEGTSHNELSIGETVDVPSQDDFPNRNIASPHASEPNGAPSVSPLGHSDACVCCVPLDSTLHQARCISRSYRSPVHTNVRSETDGCKTPTGNRPSVPQQQIAWRGRRIMYANELDTQTPQKFINPY